MISRKFKPDELAAVIIAVPARKSDRLIRRSKVWKLV